MIRNDNLIFAPTLNAQPNLRVFPIMHPSAFIRTIRGKVPVSFVCLLLTFQSAIGGASPADNLPELSILRSEVQSIQNELGTLQRDRSLKQDYVADARVFLKGALWALDLGPIESTNDLAFIRRGLNRARERIEALKQPAPPWTTARGRVIRGFVSQVDGSTQPYGLIVPAQYTPGQKIRLDVVLHGSARPSGLSELKFINSFDEINPTNKPPEADYIELHPLGRLGENAYRFEGETDVFEAIDAVRRNYTIDERKIVLRGSSLGGVGTWQIGLKHPDRFAALGPIAGPVDTIEFAKSPWKHFVPLDPLTSWQKKLLHMVDAIDYAANGLLVPVVAAMGDQDPYYASHLLIERTFAQQGIPFTGLVDAGAGHSITAAVQRKQLSLLAEKIAVSREDPPSHIRFVTWTLKYSHCHWIEILGLSRHYQRAEIDARLNPDGSIDIANPVNITRFAITLHGDRARRINLAGTHLATIPGTPRAILEKVGETWRISAPEKELTGKRPGLQGPIDDAFATRFLCVRGTGRAWNPAIGRWADAVLDRFADEWKRNYRGDLPIKNDTEVTADDIRHSNLIFFGDPGSNRWIAQLSPSLPIQWSKDELRLGGKNYSATENAVQLICPNPLVSEQGRYIVLNSGHTYHAPELRFSYTVFPRLGDWAVIRVGDNSAEKSIPPKVSEQVITSGFFDENWQHPIDED